MPNTLKSTGALTAVEQGKCLCGVGERDGSFTGRVKGGEQENEGRDQAHMRGGRRDEETECCRQKGHGHKWECE